MLERAFSEAEQISENEREFHLTWIHQFEAFAGPFTILTI